MNHKFLSNVLFGCSFGLFLECIYMLQRDLYHDSFVLGLISIAVMYVSWVIFKHREED